MADNTILIYNDDREVAAVSTMKQEAHKLIDELPDDATWEDLMHEIYVRKAIEQGLDDSRAGRTTDVSEVRRKYGLHEK